MWTFDRAAAMTVAAGIASFVTVACGSDRTTSPGRGQPVYSVAAILSSEDEIRARLDRVTRLVARALGDASVRAYVYEQLHASPYREHKLHFGPFASEEGSPFSAGIASAAGLTETALRVLLDSLFDLEFYMPVKEHWSRWTGGPDVIVASAFRDHEIPIAYDLEGSRVLLTSAEDPPAIPTLGIVPTETDFTTLPLNWTMREYYPCDGCSGGGGGGGGTSPPPPPGLAMTYSSVPGDWEGFLMGDPEFEVHVLRRSANSSTFQPIRCAGEHAPITASRYDQNGSTWSGNVELLSQIETESFATDGSQLMVQMWEDDKEACVIRKDSEWVEAAVMTAAAVVAAFVGFEIVDDGWNQTCGSYSSDEQICWLALFYLPQAPFWIIAALQNDDYVGELVPASLTGGSYYNSNHAIINEKGHVKGSVFLAGPAILPANPPPAPFSATISGPGASPPNATCTWGANVTGASAPPTYKWHRDGQLVSTAPSYSGVSGDASFDLLLSVTSADRSVTDLMTVSVSAGSAPCGAS